MLIFLYRRIINNKWLFICLLLGAIAATGVFSSIPMYTNAILQKVLTSDMENYQVDRQTIPSYIEFSNTKGLNGSDEEKKLDNILSNQLIPNLNLPVLTEAKTVKCIGMELVREGEERGTDYPTLDAMSGFNDHIKIINGRMPDKVDYRNKIYEVVVSEKSFKNLELLLDQTYALKDRKNNEVLKVRIVGIYTLKDADDPYWSQNRLDGLSDDLMLDEKTLLDIIDTNETVRIGSAQWTYYFDYHSISIEAVPNLLNAFNAQKEWINKANNIVEVKTPLQGILGNYVTREKQLRITLWVLTIPLMIVILFYSLLITGLIIKNDQNEIALLKSRGAGTMQIFALYVFESLFIAGISFVSGPPSAYFVCKALGASNGFLEFVNRRALPVKMNVEIIMYSLIASLTFAVFVLVPALKACRMGIVQFKRSRLSSGSKPFWKRFYLDFVILGLSIYGLYLFRSRQDILGMTGMQGTELKIDPLLYFISTFFLLGISLMFLRLYPLIIQLVFKIGEKYWKPVTYFTLINVGRAEKNSQLIMLFLMLALSFGIMNANQARTINKNIEDKIYYKNGADVVIEPYNNLNHQIETVSFSENKSSVKYIPPAYDQYIGIKGIESITKVMTEEKASIYTGSTNIPNVRIMAITPYEFGKTAWFRNGLLPFHLNEYLNIMSKAPKAVYLSENLLKKYKIQSGDSIRIKWGQDNSLDFTVYGFIDYFPSCNPFSEDKKFADKYFAVMNYSYVSDMLPSQPYGIWIKKQPGVADGTINSEIRDKGLKVESVAYSEQELIRSKNDPMLQGTNGVLTMCFIINMFIAFTGFLIFWMLSMKERVLKFGIFRAIGMSAKGITMILVLEQALISGCALLTGIILGSLGSDVFIPMLQMIYSSAQQVPPFKIVALGGDYLKVAAIALAMLGSALAVLSILIKRIKINQVLKLGED